MWKQEGLRGLAKFAAGMIGKYEDAAVAARYQALAGCGKSPPAEVSQDTAASPSRRRSQT